MACFIYYSFEIKYEGKKSNDCIVVRNFITKTFVTFSPVILRGLTVSSLVTLVFPIS